jgi:hypothetical protein
MLAVAHTPSIPTRRTLTLKYNANVRRVMTLGRGRPWMLLLADWPIGG